MPVSFIKIKLIFRWKKPYFYPFFAHYSAPVGGRNLKYSLKTIPSKDEAVVKIEVNRSSRSGGVREHTYRQMYNFIYIDNDNFFLSSHEATPRAMGSEKWVGGFNVAISTLQ